MKPFFPVVNTKFQSFVLTAQSKICNGQ